MEFYTFNKESGKKITKFDSDFVMSRIIQTDTTAHIGCMFLEADGVIGYHQAVIPQLLLVLAGEGFVRGETDECFKVQAGDAVFWTQEEWHETKTSTGLIALVIESETLNPSVYMTSRNTIHPS